MPPLVLDNVKLGKLANLIIEELRKGLDSECAARAEALFKAEVAAGRIQFRLRLDQSQLANALHHGHPGA